MDRMKRSRRPVRGSITKTLNEAEVDLAADVPDIVELRCKLKKLEDLLEEILPIDEAIMDHMLDENCTDDEQDDERVSSEEYRDKIRKMTLRINHILDKRCKSPSPSEFSTASEGPRRNFKLPKLELMKFDGKLKDWLGWWSQFQKIDEDLTLHTTDKFQYLLQALTPKSEARELVESFPPSEANYPKAVEALKNRFGKESLLVQVYVRELLKLAFNNVTNKEKIPVSTMFIKLKSHLRALESLKLAATDPSTWLFPLVESSLPVELLQAWQRSPLSKKDGTLEVPIKNNLDFLMEFIEAEVEGEQRIELARTGFQSMQCSDSKPNSKKTDHKTKSGFNVGPSTAAGLHVGNAKPACIFCEKSHPSHECFKAHELAFSEKTKLIKSKRACFTCMKIGHDSKNCKSFVKCSGCGKKHHHIMCPDNPKNQIKCTSITEETVTTTSVSSNQTSGGPVLLKTLLVRIMTPGMEKVLRVLFDDGSQSSYIVSKVAEQANCKAIGSHLERNLLFGGVLTEAEKRTTYQVPLTSLQGKKQQVLELQDKPRIACNIPRLPKGPWMSELKKNRIWINDHNFESDEIDILIGADLMPKLMTGQSIKLKCGLSAHQTIFGWTIMGPIKNARASSIAMTVTSLHITDVGESSIQQLWDLEVLGIRDLAEAKTRQEKEEIVKRHFLDTVSRNQDGRYSVKLPWVSGIQNIPTNFTVAEKRLQIATKKLVKDGMYQKYDDIFTEWEGLDFIEVCPSEETKSSHFLPHRPVYKLESETTPVRPVFDASCKVGRNPSLNDLLEKGPNFIELIPSVMLRFRERRVGVISDIKKAFQMIQVSEPDSNFLKFLWWENSSCKQLKVYRHKRVPFGVTCSPFLLGAVIENHLMHVQDSDLETAKKLWKSLYVDNCITSVDTIQDYEEFKARAVRIMEDAKMELRLWEYGSEDSIHEDSKPISVLGMKWFRDTDTLTCDLVPEMPEEFSKRTLLSTVQKIFDPLGFLNPAIIVPKLILQEAWAQKLDWDEPLPQEITSQFIQWASELKALEQVHIPRHVQLEITPSKNIQIHSFSDASQKAYAVVIFARVKVEDKVYVHLLQSKSRVAPLKKMTIPRLELMSCVISARLCKSVIENLNLDVPVYFWSDSTTALSWIRGNDQWGTFVGNRVREISQISNQDSWRHVPGILNPADLPSRGCTPENLLKSKWWEGPAWLKMDSESWPSQNIEINEEEVQAERKKSSVSVASINKNLPIIVEEPWYGKHFSSFSSIVRLVGWMKRFVDKCRKQSRESGIFLSQEEIARAENIVYHLIQEEVFPANADRIGGFQVIREKEDNARAVLRLKTKLLYRQDTGNFKTPVLLPNSHPVVDRLIQEEHLKSGHGGIQFLMSSLRDRVWIIQARKAIRKVVQKCPRCQRYKAKPSVVPAAPLPENRVRDARVFQITGVDFAGPLYLKNGSKVWIVLFTCAVYRAIHLELANSLNTDTFIMALSRFIGRRGRPSTIYSDNGTNFRGSDNLFKLMDWKKIEKDTRVHRIQWIFNPPSASWWGGFWERLIGTVKGLLRRMLGNSKLLYVQLETLMCQVEAVVNGRPLTYVTEDPDDLIPLTPAHFIQDTQQTDNPEIEMLDGAGFRRKYKDLVQLKQELRGRFRSEYLGQLVQSSKAKKVRQFSVGEIVMVSNETLKRLEWPMAKIVELIPGRDGNVRVARIKTSKGELIRPIQRLVPLEIRSEAEFPILQKELRPKGAKKNMREEDGKEVTTRCGRRIKKPIRYIF